ncbi:hypothetical protein [Leifsonia shinshuensis]
MVDAATWWANISPDSRDWLVQHPRERVSWHVVPELQKAGADLVQPDPSRSVFLLTDADWAWIGDCGR